MKNLVWNWGLAQQATRTGGLEPGLEGRLADFSAAFKTRERVRKGDATGTPTLKMKKSWWQGPQDEKILRAMMRGSSDRDYTWRRPWDNCPTPEAVLGKFQRPPPCPRPEVDPIPAVQEKVRLFGEGPNRVWNYSRNVRLLLRDSPKKSPKGNQRRG